MQLCDGKKVLTFCEVPLFCGGLDVGQEVFTAGKGAGRKVEAGLHFGRGAVVFLADLVGGSFFFVDPLELFFQDFLVFAFWDIVFQELPELVQAGVCGGVHFSGTGIHFLLGRDSGKLRVEIIISCFAIIVEAPGFFGGCGAFVGIDAELFCFIDDDGKRELSVIIVGYGNPAVYFS